MKLVPDLILSTIASDAHRTYGVWLRMPPGASCIGGGSSFAQVMRASSKDCIALLEVKWCSERAP